MLLFAEFELTRSQWGYTIVGIVGFLGFLCWALYQKPAIHWQPVALLHHLQEKEWISAGLNSWSIGDDVMLHYSMHNDGPETTYELCIWSGQDKDCLDLEYGAKGELLRPDDCSGMDKHTYEAILIIARRHLAAMQS